MTDDHALGAAIGAEEFSLLMERFSPFSERVALAVSGGPDSMALAFCAKRWALRPFIALIVEHGMRAESAAEAAEVKARLQGMGLAAEILPWEHGELSSRREEKAREARYGLLAEACRRFDAGDLLIAHHGDDQAETVLMRLAKGSGIDGLAGIAAESRRDGLRLLRPLLPVSKARLIATCDAARLAYAVDPSNASGENARSRLRKILPLLADEGLTAQSLMTLGARAREAMEALDHATREFLKNAAEAEKGGSVRIDRASLRAAPRAIALRALAACLRYVREGEHPPEHASLSSVLDAILEKGEAVRTFYGCIVSVAQNRVTILREPSTACEVLPLSPGKTVLWDGRWLVTADSMAFPATVRALGNPPHEVIDALAPGLRHQIPQGRVRASLPAIWEGDRLRAIPSFGEKAAFRLAYRKQGLF